MTIWTTFSPGKVCWELTYIETHGKSPSNDWQKHSILIQESLQLLKDAGVSGIRLVIFPGEITSDGKKFNLTPIIKMLELCKKTELAVDLCIGPFQFPHYPGIYIPPKLLHFVPDNELFLDVNPILAEYGMNFLTQLITNFANHERIHGFHFANEWPDMQRVGGKEALRIGISEKFMLEAAKLIKQLTNKPIVLNTNIDASNKAKLTNTFTNILTILGPQASLGFDVYPSQETWRKAPLQKLARWFESYPRSFAWSQKKFAPCEMHFVEVEAQPWGNGKSWYQLIKEEADPNQKVLRYRPDSLIKTWKKHIKGTECKRVSLWGSDFWLASHKMGITWPLAQLKTITNKTST